MSNTSPQSASLDSTPIVESLKCRATYYIISILFFVAGCLLFFYSTYIKESHDKDFSFLFKYFLPAIVVYALVMVVIGLCGYCDESWIYKLKLNAFPDGSAFKGIAELGICIFGAFACKRIGEAIDIQLILCCFCLSLHSLFLSRLISPGIDFAPTVLFAGICLSIGFASKNEEKLSIIISIICGIIIFTLRNVFFHLDIRRQSEAPAAGEEEKTFCVKCFPFSAGIIRKITCGHCCQNAPQLM